MARKKRNPAAEPDLSGFQGALYHAPAQAQLVWGVGAIILGYAALKYMPKAARTLIPILASAFLPPSRRPASPRHPEAAEPIRTLFDERLLGRSEIIREIADPKAN